MQKEDIQWAVLGILILLVIAFVIKPMATGQPVNIGLPTPTPTPTPIPEITEVPTIAITTPIITITPTETPTPVVTWNKQTQTVEFVDPSVYGLNLNQSIPNATIIPSGPGAIRSSNTTNFATFSGQFSGTTQVIEIPFPAWELNYTATPLSSDIQKQSEISGGRFIVTPTTGVVEQGFSGSFSTAMPFFSIQVMDADDPNRIVRTITPPGGLNPQLWTGDNGDPRPWKEKFYEGNHKYYFIIQTRLLKEYAININIPLTYVGGF